MIGMFEDWQGGQYGWSRRKKGSKGAVGRVV